jgi:hypothetical protein
MTALIITLALALSGTQEGQPEKRVPKDSIELTVVGCLKGRVLSTVPRAEPDVQRGPFVGERQFRLAAKKDVMDEIKKRNHHLVEVVGVVKRSALDDKGVKSGRVTVSGGSPVGGPLGIPSPGENLPVMDVTSVRPQASSCN